MLPASRIDRCLHQIIEDQSRLRPAETAIHAWDGNISYSELDGYSNQLAYHLLSRGVSSGENVPLLMDKSRWTVVGVIGILKAGTACVPLDRGYPAARIESILEHVNANVILTDETNLPRLEGKARLVIALSTKFFETFLDQKLPSRLIDPVNTTAFILFTSGSTGTPKGVVRKHAANYTAVIGVCKGYGLNSNSRSLQFGSLTFIFSMNDMLATFLAGGCVCIPSEKDRVNDVNGSMRSLAVNHCAVTPTVARLIDFTSIAKLDPLVIGGEPATRHEMITWSFQSRLIIEYGSSEAGSSTRRLVTAENHDPSNIGGHAGLGLWIVNPIHSEKLAPIGAPGELLVEGDALANGYLNDKESSRERFIEAPPWLSSFRNNTGGSFFKTGDIVQYHCDGSIIYLGRKDSQVKLRGQRVELEEVECHVRKCLDYEPDVVAQVIELLGAKQNPILAGFIHFKDVHVAACDAVILNAHHQLTGAVKSFPEIQERLAKIAANIRPKLADRLPQYMIPSFYVPLARIPLTTSGKLHRKEIKEAASQISPEDLLACTAHEKSQDGKFTEMETQLQRLWAHILGIQPSSINLRTNFFEKGGDSYVAIQMVALAREYQIGLQVADILRFPTLQNLASHAVFLEDRNLPKVCEPFSALSVGPIDDFLHTSIFPRISFPQRDVLDVFPATAHQAKHLRNQRPRFGLYYQAMKLGNIINLDRIRRSCEKLVQHHEILRALFIEVNGTFFQVNLGKLPLPFAQHDIDENSPDFSSICQHDKTRASPEDCFTKFFVFRQRDSSMSWLVLRLSHAQFDAYCIPQLIKGLSAAIVGEALPQTCGFSALIYYREENKRRAYQYWSNLLDGSSVTVISESSAPRPGDATIMPVATRRVISLPVLPDDITFSTLMCAAWAMVLSQLSGTSDVVFGRLVIGRSAGLGDVDKICGPCYNVIPARIQFGPLWKGKDLLSTMQEQVISSMRFEFVHWDEIVRNCTNWHAGTPADTMIHNDAPMEAYCLHLGEQDVYPAWILDEQEYEENLTIYAYPSNAERMISTRTDTSKVSREVADSLLHKLSESMRQLVADPENSVASIMQNISSLAFEDQTKKNGNFDIDDAGMGEE